MCYVCVVNDCCRIVEVEMLNQEWTYTTVCTQFMFFRGFFRVRRVILKTIGLRLIRHVMFSG